ncbi:putative Ntn-hydrolase superfamily protein [Novosphingobium chloroacetimidivorans]|uniref:Putative Ntn-hydrolase superfamily protein n=1 Tax=Novosphingobium chloroacetimidivorans TaxID=1428314 RepID=A0A7W7NYZ0_9SPHN|nr:DUF1028 domain-containing protein [Novosphingobium chloroacetimidivorans]MBB4860662.1 putative Ntn-hydrolase superfamily protein [Novosphingobium chloroacetimidivorans]
MTFSIAARCPQTGMFGMALSSSSPAVAARCAHARAGVGAVATQNITDPRLGPAGLDLLAQGLNAEATLACLVTHAGTTAPFRQLTVVDAQGRTAAHSGARALGRHSHHCAQDAVAAGNMLVDPALPRAMVEAFLARPHLHFADRLLAAMDRALEVGGEEGPVHSAGLLIVDRESWPLVDLRVDWDEAPITRLHSLWVLWQPQMHDYVTRGIDPMQAPSYGVPGDP